MEMPFSHGVGGGGGGSLCIMGVKIDGCFFFFFFFLSISFVFLPPFFCAYAIYSSWTGFFLFVVCFFSLLV